MVGCKSESVTATSTPKSTASADKHSRNDASTPSVLHFMSCNVALLAYPGMPSNR